MTRAPARGPSPIEYESGYQSRNATVSANCCHAPPAGAGAWSECASRRMRGLGASANSATACHSTAIGALCATRSALLRVAPSCSPVSMLESRQVSQSAVCLAEAPPGEASSQQRSIGSWTQLKLICPSELFSMQYATPPMAAKAVLQAMARRQTIATRGLIGSRERLYLMQRSFRT